MRTVTNKCDKCGHEVTNTFRHTDQCKAAQGGVSGVEVPGMSSRLDLCSACEKEVEELTREFHHGIQMFATGRLESFAISAVRKTSEEKA